MTVEFKEEDFDAGQDYQKAKRTCLMFCLFLSMLAIFADRGDKGEILKIFELKINGPLWIVLSFMLVCVTYCACNFFINERRVRVNHSELIKQNGNGNSLEALRLIEEKLVNISSRLDEVGSCLSKQIEMINYQPGVLGKIIDEIDYSDEFSQVLLNNIIVEVALDEKINGQIYDRNDRYGMDMLKENITKKLFKDFNKEYRDRLAKMSDEAAKSLFDKYIRDSGEHIEFFSKEVERNYFGVTNSINSMRHSLDTFSQKIYGGEVAFFKGECGLVYLSVIISTWLGVARITYDALH